MCIRDRWCIVGCLLNLVLHKTVKNLDTRSTIINKTRQILAYAEDIALIGRNVRILEEVFGKLKREERKMGLKVNASKTIYMKMGPEYRRGLR